MRTESLLTDEQLDEARTFVDTHVHPEERGYALYAAGQIGKWLQNLPDRRKPFWLRRGFDMGGEFEATIDYTIVTPEQERIYGTLLIDREVQVILPGDEPDVTGGELTSTRPFSLEAIALAVAEVEAAYKAPQ